MATKSKSTNRRSTKSDRHHSSTRTRIDPTAKVKWIGKNNPFREGSGAFERTEFVRKHSGETVAKLRSKTAATTLATLRKLKLIAVAS